MTIQFYRDRKKRWRWRAIARNGRVVADCGEGYSSATKAWKGFTALQNAQRVDIEGWPGTEKVA